MWLFLAVAPVALTGSPDDALLASLVTPTIFEAEIAAVKAATNLTDEARDRLIELYHKSQRNLEIA